MTPEEHEARFTRTFETFYKKWAPKDPDESTQFVADLFILFQQFARSGINPQKH